MKYVNLKTGEVLLNADYVDIKPYTFSYNEEEKKFEHGKWIEIDDQLITPIIILNRKGYITEFCCSGHVYKTLLSSYVKFEEPIFKLQELKKYPLDADIFSIEKDNSIRMNELYKHEDNPIVAQKLIDRFCIELLAWAISIPNRKDCKMINE